MLESLRIENFQVHSGLNVEFDPGLNVIIGPTDSGKSSIYRALRWVCLNQPSGVEFLKEGEEEVRVEVKFDGHSVTRYRRKEVNLYHLDGDEFKAFGSTSVPQPIVDQLRLDDLNFQSQHDSPFWLSLTPGEVSKRLNQVIDLSIIDSVLSFLKKEVTRQRINADTCRTRVKNLKASHQDLVWIEQADEDYKKVEAVQQQHTSCRLRRDALHIAISRFDSIRTQITSGAAQVDDLRLIVEQASRCGKVKKKQQRLISLIARYPENLDQQDSIIFMDELCRFMHELRIRAEQLASMLDRRDKKQAEIAQISAQVDQLEKEVGEQKVCPLCGVPLVS